MLQCVQKQYKPKISSNVPHSPFTDPRAPKYMTLTNKTCQNYHRCRPKCFFETLKSSCSRWGSNSQPPHSLGLDTAYKYGALTDCATGASHCLPNIDWDRPQYFFCKYPPPSPINVWCWLPENFCQIGWKSLFCSLVMIEDEFEII